VKERVRGVACGAEATSGMKLRGLVGVHMMSSAVDGVGTWVWAWVGRREVRRAGERERESARAGERERKGERVGQRRSEE
jgi:hypothetical protein